MPKYIDADALLKEAKRISGPFTGDGWDNFGVYALIERQPAADVEPVVRCKECRYWEKVEYYHVGYKMCCRLLRAEMHGECFCSLGTRKDKEDAE